MPDKKIEKGNLAREKEKVFDMESEKPCCYLLIYCMIMSKLLSLCEPQFSQR